MDTLGWVLNESKACFNMPTFGMFHIACSYAESSGILKQNLVSHRNASAMCLKATCSSCLKTLLSWSSEYFAKSFK